MSEKIYRIRQAWIADMERMTALLQELFQIEGDFIPDPARQRAGLKLLLASPSAVILVADNSAGVVGMCTVQKVISTAEGGPAGWLEDLVVDRKYRRQGIGRALLEAAGDWAREQGMTRLQLLTEADNETALNFYFKMGWQSTDLICRRRRM